MSRGKIYIANHSVTRFLLFEQAKYKVGHDDHSCSTTFIFSRVELLSVVCFIPSHIIESADCDSTIKPKDRLVSLLDQIELHVEQLRRDAWRLEEEKDTLLSTLDTIRNNELLGFLEEPDKDDVLRYAERLSMRCLTVDVLVKIQRDNVQQEALHQVNGLIDGLIVNLRQDPSGTRQKCAAFMNACSSQAIGHSDKNFETAILGCTLDDQKRVKKRLQGLLDYIDKMHTIEFQ